MRSRQGRRPFSIGVGAVSPRDRFLPLQQRGVTVGMPLLVEYYNELPQQEEDIEVPAGGARLKKALEGFKGRVSERYTEGTLQRLLHSPDVYARRAAVLALGLVGTMTVNKPVARMLHDADSQVRQMAAEALWSIWFRADAEHAEELQRVARMSNPNKALNNLNALIAKAPRYAEAYNQRAVLFFRTGDYQRSIADCEVTLKLNPFHFGAQAGMAQCYMKLRKPRPALRAFRNALRINPELDGVEATIRALEDALGGDGRGDKK
jgi:tetratricopeptide (TPR) repeat protein